MDLLRAIAAIRTPFGEKLWQFFTFFGEETFVAVVLCILFWCVNKNLSYKIGVTFFFGGLLTQGLKILFQIPRPWVLDPGFVPVGSALETATGFSFPSGHTAAAGSLFFPPALSSRRRWWRWPLLLMPFAVGFSRLYLGVHTLLDVGCALAVTAVFAALVQAVSRTGLWEKPQVVSAVLLGFSAAVLLYAFCRRDITVDMLKDCVKAAAAGVGFAVGYYIEKKWIRFEPDAVWWMQVIKLTVGLAVALAVKSGIKALFGDTLPVAAARYFLLIVWIIAGWPALFRLWTGKRGQKGDGKAGAAR